MEGPTRISLRVSPGAARPGVVGRRGSAWKVRVNAPPENGKANDAVVGLLAEALDVPRRDVAIVSGHGGRDKVVELAGIASAEVERKLSSASGEAS